MPAITILLPVYNAESHLVPAIKSLLSQTFKDFKLLILNDCSSDRSLDIINAFDDNRIEVVSNEQNRGVTYTLNKGLRMCGDCEFIARMDADDISEPNRLEEQIDFLTVYRDVAVCGTWAKTFGSSERKIMLPRKHEFIKSTMLFRNAIYHSTVMMRQKELVDKNISYNEQFTHAQDFELWARQVDTIKFSNLPKYLVRYRVHSSSVTNKAAKKVAKNDELHCRIYMMMLEKLGVRYDSRELRLHRLISGNLTETLSAEEFKAALRWMKKIEVANNKSHYFDQGSLKLTLRRMAARVMLHVRPVTSGTMYNIKDLINVTW